MIKELFNGHLVLVDASKGPVTIKAKPEIMYKKIDSSYNPVILEGCDFNLDWQYDYTFLKEVNDVLNFLQGDVNGR